MNDSLYVRRCGSGPEAIVGLHGWNGNHRTFARFAEHLAPEQSLFCFDLPGSGRSAPPEAWTMEAFIDPILRTIDALGLERFRLIGNCAGAVFGFELALRAKDRVTDIVAIDPFAYTPWYFRLLAHPILGRLFYYSTFANPLGRWFTDAALRSKRTEQTSLVRGFESVRHEATWRTLRLLTSLEDPTRYLPIRSPVLLLEGERTFGAVRRSVEMYRAIWPQSRHVILEGAGHLPIQEAEQQVLALCLKRERLEPSADKEHTVEGMRLLRSDHRERRVGD